MLFNSCLKCRIQKEKRIRWLDFVDDLIYKDDDGDFQIYHVTGVSDCTSSLKQ
jgi:hypothetical protein